MDENEREVEIWCKGREREEFLDQDISLLGEWYSEYFNWWFEECGLSNLSFSACDRWMKRSTVLFYQWASVKIE